MSVDRVQLDVRLGEQRVQLGEQAGRLFLDAHPDVDLATEIAEWETVPGQLSLGTRKTQQNCIYDFARGFANALRAELARREQQSAA
jgi:hypothetical protein